MNDLEYLLAGYLNQDWYIGHDSWQAVVDEFMAKDPHRVAGVPGEIDYLLSSHPQDEDLSEALVDLGCAYNPAEGDRAWLEAVRDRIRAAGSEGTN